MILSLAKPPFDAEIFDLLLEADPEEQAIAKYIDRCDVFLLRKKRANARRSVRGKAKRQFRNKKRRGCF